MKGTNNKDNLVNLTPEEHYLAHQLLVKIYPDNHSLINAAVMMTVDANGKRVNNKLYGWIRRRLSITNSISQSGQQNSQYGTCWVHDLSGNSKKINLSDLHSHLISGWCSGRTPRYTCVSCNSLFYARQHRAVCSIECRTKNNPMYSILIGRDSEFIEHYNILKSVAKVRRAMCFTGRPDYFYCWARNVLKDHSSTDRIDESESSDVSSILTDLTNKQ